jgi:streptomycin 6-kinase
MLAREAARDGWKAWVSELPEVVRTLEERWSLRVGEPFEPGGRTAWVAPATGEGKGGGGDLVVKVGWPHQEAEHEADALRLWDGGGAVGLLAAEEMPRATALLLERCVPGSRLSVLPEPDQDTIIAGLLQRLWVTPGSSHPFRPLRVMCDQWADEFEENDRAGDRRSDPGLMREGIARLRQLPRDPELSVVLCTDLHAGNVLAAAREPWLAIDPKPYVGDPAYDVVQHLLNCRGRLHADPRALVDRVASLAGLDGERVLAWLFARCVQESRQWPDLIEVAEEIAP